MSSTDARSINPPRRASPVLVLRAGWGSLLVLRPDAGLRLLGGPQATRSARIVLRILGARHLADLTVELAKGPAWRKVGGVVDALHATSALAFAATDRRWRRAALTDALIASLFASKGLRAGGLTA